MAAFEPILNCQLLTSELGSPMTVLNETITKLAVFAGGTATAAPTNTPPGSPAEGDVYMTSTSPTGAWSGHANAIAHFTGGIWVFYTPTIGVNFGLRTTGAWYFLNGSSLWELG